MGVISEFGVPGFEFQGLRLKKMYFYTIVMKLEIKGHPKAGIHFIVPYFYYSLAVLEYLITKRVRKCVSQFHVLFIYVIMFAE